MEIKVYCQNECENRIGRVTEFLHEITKAENFEIFKYDVLYLRNAYDPARKQYDAAFVLRKFEYESHILKIIITHEKIYYPGFDFLYGAAYPGIALISDAYTADDTEFFKELYHETGHAAGLKHCGNYCVMRPAKIPGDLSQKPCFLCPDCRKMFESAVDNTFCNTHFLTNVRSGGDYI